MRRAAVPALVALLLGGCVYYNGMYNTKRLAGSARRAEQEGRPFEANNLWGQVITRADSLVVRHPRSKYVDQALVYKGVALARLGQCPEAVPSLARASVLELEGDIAEEAALALGRCQLEVGDPGAARIAFARVAESHDARRRREARLQLARALRLTGEPRQGLAALEGMSDPRAPMERFLALAASDQRDDALAVAESLLAGNDSIKVWDAALQEVGAASPAVASELVDRLGKHPSSTPAIHARRLLEDADRLRSVDSVRADQRLRETAAAGAGTETGHRAELLLLQQSVRRIDAADRLAPLIDSLQQLSSEGGGVAAEALVLAGTLARVRAAADSSGPEAPEGDLRLFLAAEAARDAVGAPGLALTLFRQLVDTWPDSPYAPKAWLAGRLLDPAWGEQVRYEMEARYGESPYLAFVRGEEPAAYRTLEDSLQAYAVAHAAAPVRRRTAPAGRRQDAPETIDGDRVRPGNRARPPRGVQ